MIGGSGHRVIGNETGDCHHCQNRRNLKSKTMSPQICADRARMGKFSPWRHPFDSFAALSRSGQAVARRKIGGACRVNRKRGLLHPSKAKVGIIVRTP